jgi:hypothetical protein
LWSGILVPPIAWATNFFVSYALTPWACGSQHPAVLRLLTVATLAVIAFGATLSWRELQQIPADAPTDAGGPMPRARFMAMLGIAASALFGIVVIASGLPPWLANVCK